MGILRRPLPSQAELLDVLSYDPGSGELRWKRLPPRAKRSLLGSLAGRANSRGYIQVKVGGRSYAASRVIWKMVTGDDPGECVDHKNGNTSDNKWSNLRRATIAQNTWNARRSSKNKTGVKGIKWMPDDNVWCAYITAGAKQIHLGRFTELDRAVATRLEAAKRLHGEFLRID